MIPHKKLTKKLNVINDPIGTIALLKNEQVKTYFPRYIKVNNDTKQSISAVSVTDHRG